MAVKLHLREIYQKINIALVIGGIGVLLAASALLVRSGQPVPTAKKPRA